MDFVSVSDFDNDIVRCRWATYSYYSDDECGGICGGLPNAELDPVSLVFSMYLYNCKTIKVRRMTYIDSNHS